MSNEVLVAFIVAIYGTFVSFVEERFGKFQDLPANVKQLINATLNLVLPYVVVFIQPYWKLEWGDSNQVLTSVVLLVVPMLVWVVSQVTHAVDRKLVN